MINARIDEKGWARCGECSHVLFKMKYMPGTSTSICMDMLGIEVKCHSCKEINALKGNDENDQTR